MKKMILSVDTGIDDALAIAYALGQTEYSLLGITVSYGMAPVEKTYRNTTYLLRLLQRPDIPVYAGSTAPLFESRSYDGHFHGMDGAANLLGEPSTEDLPDPGQMDAVTFLTESARVWKQDLILVTTGPLTDLARAIQRDPGFVSSIGSVYTMGGALTCPGNSSPYAEANIKADPHASKIVLESGLPLTLIGLDVTRKTILTHYDLDQIKGIHTDASKYYYKLLSFYLDEYKTFHPYLNGCALHDPLAVAVACNPMLVKTFPFHLTVITEGEGKGRITENISLLSQQTTPEFVNVALDVNAQCFEKNFFRLMHKVLNPVEKNNRSCGLYLAGPMVFQPGGSAKMDFYKRLSQNAGYTLPESSICISDCDTPMIRATKHRMRCLDSLSQSDFIAFNVQPFRGSQPDSGTMFELGYAIGRHTPVCLFQEPDSGKCVDGNTSFLSFEEALKKDFFQIESSFVDEFDRGHAQKHILVYSRNIPAHLTALVERLDPNGAFLLFYLPFDSISSDRTVTSESVFPADLMKLARNTCGAIIDLSDWEGGYEPLASAAALCGYLYARDIPVMGYLNDSRPLIERVPCTRQDDGRYTDENNCMVENFGLPVNLMLGTTCHFL